jgi:four helix bundle protein
MLSYKVAAKKVINSFEDLEVYQKLLELHLEVHEITMGFPRFEMYELGSQLRRCTNSSPANVAEGWNNRHINIYLEGINRALGEIRETKHHLSVAHRKKYVSDSVFAELTERYRECGRMLRGLEQSLERTKVKRRSV